MGHYTHDTHAQSSRGPLASPKPHKPTAPNRPFQNTLVNPDTSTSPHHHQPAAPTTDITPQHPGMNLAGRGEKGGRPCRCICSALKAGPRRLHRSLYSASPASYTGLASLVLAFKGPVWGLYGACVGPVYGLHGAVLRLVERPAASCSCQSEGATESSLSRLARSLSAHCAIWRARWPLSERTQLRVERPLSPFSSL